MRTIDVDDEVYGLIDSRAILCCQSHNQALRGLLELDAETPRAITGGEDAVASLKPSEVRVPEKSRKQRKADLWELVDSGYIPDGCLLHLRTAGGKAVEGYEATVSNGRLLWRGNDYSMSALAKLGLNAVGKMSDSVRGPSYWYTDYGESIQDIWERHLRQREEAAEAIA